MMTSAFKNPTYQHMVNSSSNSKFYALQSDLVNQSIAEYKTSNRSRYASNLMKRMSPEVWAQLCYDNSLTRNINWSKILEDFLPRNQDDAGHVHGSNPQRKQRYKPVVLRNKTPFVQLNQDPVGAESNSSTRLSKAYTLPHNRDSDVPESQPTGDSSINNFVEMRDIVSPFYPRILNIDLQSSLRMFMSYIQDFNRLFLDSSPVQQLNNVLNFLYDFFMSITMGLRQAAPRIQRVILNRYSYLNIFNGYSMPLSLHVVESNPSSSNAVSNEQRLSRSTIVSYGQYCCPELRNVLSESENTI